MKKYCLILVCCLALCGCAAADTFETVADEYAQPVIEQKTVTVAVEADTALQGETGTLYLCDGYEVSVEILSAGDLNGTLQSICGFGVDELTVIQTTAAGASRYEWVWTAAGESGDVVCHAVVLDDGAYHYCLTASAPVEMVYSLKPVWEALFSSFAIS